VCARREYVCVLIVKRAGKRINHWSTAERKLSTGRRRLAVVEEVSGGGGGLHAVYFLDRQRLN